MMSSPEERLVTVRSSPALYVGRVGAVCKKDQLLEVVRGLSQWIVSNVTYDVEAWEESKGDDDDLVRSDVEGALHNTVHAISHGDFTLCRASYTENKAGDGRYALVRRKATCRGYSDLFCLLCRHAGIEARKITGVVKTHNFVPGDDINTSIPNHEWNAVRLNSSSAWHLIDLTWAAGHIDRKSGSFKPDFSPHFLFTNPRDFARDHFPSNPKWQLLHRPLSVKTFQTDLLLKPGYFKLGILKCSLASGSLHCVNESSDVVFHLTRHLYFTYSLHQLKSGAAVHQCVSIEWSSSSCVIRVHFPKPGPYVLRVYARDIDGPTRNILVQKLQSYWVGAPTQVQTRLGSIRPSLLLGLTSHAEVIDVSVYNFQSCLYMSPDGYISTPVMSFKEHVQLSALLWPLRPDDVSPSSSRTVAKAIITAGEVIRLRLQVLKKGRTPCKAWRLGLFARRRGGETSKCFCNLLLLTCS